LQKSHSPDIGLSSGELPVDLSNMPSTLPLRRTGERRANKQAPIGRFEWRWVLTAADQHPRV
jgi:hypothetical protein